MSAVYGGYELCQTTPEVRDWVEKNIPLTEHRVFQWVDEPPSIFHGLTFFRQNESNLPLRLNVLRWPSGASRWATYHFLATDEQLFDLRAICYGAEETDEDPAEAWKTAPQKLTLHGCGDTIECYMWMLPPRPLSATPTAWARANRLWLITLVDSRYWLNQDHCGEMAEEDVSSWDNMLDWLRERVGHDPAAWDCPSVHADWLEPHVDLQIVNSLPLGLMIDAVAWNVGRKVSFDMAKTSEAYPPYIRIREWDWHDTRARANLDNTSFKRMAGGEYALDTRDLTACLPEFIRVTFSDGEDEPRRHDDATVSDISPYEDNNGKGTITFHDHIEWDDMTDGERGLLIDRIAQAWLGFQAKAVMDTSYAGHVLWLPEALSDAIEWHEKNDEDCSLVPDPTDGKIRRRIATGHIARTRVYRPPVNQVSEDLWHGHGVGSGSGTSGSQSNTIDCPDGSSYSFTLSRTSGGYVVTVGG